jgi:type II secretory pathway pseudopilin PulG
MQQSESHRCRAFTTIELLVVIGIIVALIGILIPVVGKVRESAKATDTAAWVQQLGGAIEAYHSDFRAYPGPLHNDKIRSPAASQDVVITTVTGFAPATANGGNVDKITMSENLVLGLAGGLKPNTAGTGR